MSEREDESAEDAHHPKVDVSKSLHSAGHETKDLGFEGLADTGPIERNAEAIEEEEEALEAEDRALESGQFGAPRPPDR